MKISGIYIYITLPWTFRYSKENACRNKSHGILRINSWKINKTYLEVEGKELSPQTEEQILCAKFLVYMIIISHSLSTRILNWSSFYYMWHFILSDCFLKITWKRLLLFPNHSFLMHEIDWCIVWDAFLVCKVYSIGNYINI